MEWISVKDRLPESCDRILCACNGEVDFGYFFSPDEWKFLDGGDWFNIPEVTHWMPIPKPPKDE